MHRALSRFRVAPLLLALAACATAPDRPSNSLEARMEGRFDYRCQNGERIEVRFAANAGVAALIRADGTRHELQRQETSAGFVYQQGDVQISGNDRLLTLVAPDVGTVSCQMI